MITLTIPGKPIAKKRPRFARRGKYVAAINDQVTEEGRWILEAQQQVREKISGPLYVALNFFVPRPRGHFGTGKNSGTLKAWASEAYPTAKPDIDNYAKFALDCLNGVAWDDDAAVVQMTQFKAFDDGDGPRTEIQIRPALPSCAHAAQVAQNK